MINSMILLAAQSGERVNRQTGAFQIRLELVLSLIAIIVAIGVAIFEWFWNRSIHREDLEAELYKNIFEEYLIKRIPKARNYFYYNGKMLDGTDKLVDVLNNLRRDILFFKFWDNTYYEELRKKLQDLEDQLVMCTKPMNSDELVEFHNSVDQKLQCIFQMIMRKYIGKKKHI